MTKEDYPGSAHYITSCLPMSMQFHSQINRSLVIPGFKSLKWQHENPTAQSSMTGLYKSKRGCSHLLNSVCYRASLLWSLEELQFLGLF